MLYDHCVRSAYINKAGLMFWTTEARTPIVVQGEEKKFWGLKGSQNFFFLQNSTRKLVEFWEPGTFSQPSENALYSTETLFDIDLVGSFGSK